jgi:virulence factor
VRGTRQGPGAYGFTAFCQKSVVTTPVDARYIYRELVKQIVGMFTAKTMPIPADELLEVVAFQEAALRSKEAGGDEVTL